MDHKESLSSGFRLGALVSLCLVFVATCAHQTPLEKKVALEVAQEEPIPLGTDMYKARREIVEEAGLSAKQKRQLLDLYSEAAFKSRAIRKELSKNQQVLFSSLVNPKASDDEIDVLKERIVDLEERRTKVFLDSLDRAKRILGRWSSEDERYYRAFLMQPQLNDVVN